MPERKVNYAASSKIHISTKDADRKAVMYNIRGGVAELTVLLASARGPAGQQGQYELNGSKHLKVDVEAVTRHISMGTGDRDNTNLHRSELYRDLRDQLNDHFDQGSKADVELKDELGTDINAVAAASAHDPLQTGISKHSPNESEKKNSLRTRRIEMMTEIISASSATTTTASSLIVAIRPIAALTATIISLHDFFGSFFPSASHEA
jgi:hypothetical protein